MALLDDNRRFPQGDKPMGPLDDNRTVSLTPGIFPALAPGTLLQGRYRIESQIGKGGMGFVYIVRDERFSSSLGIRSIRSLKEMIPRVNEIEQAKYMLNFRREAEVLESLRHPNIPRVYDWFEQSNRAYLVLDYVEGMDLEQVRDRTPGLLDPHTVVNWMVQLCKIVQYLHEHRPDPIIFRDLKPSNVILTPDQRIELIDFGIAKTFRSADPQTSIGTQGYAAPEMYEGKAEPRSDVYTLGAMMHHLLSNTDPRLFPPFTFQKRPPRRSNPEVSAKLEQVIMKAVEHEPSKRYQTVVELRVALQEALGLPDTNSMPAVPPGASTPLRTWGIAATMNTQSDGKKLWEFQTEEEVRAKPAVSNGMVLVGSYDSNLYALDIKTGKQIWKFDTDGGVCVQPAIYKNMVIFGSEDYFVYAVDLQGKQLWKVSTHHFVRSSPRVLDDRVYVGSDDGMLHMLDPRRDGRLLQRFRTYRELQTTPAFADDLVYFGSSDATFYAADALTLEKKWQYRAQASILSSPAVENGVVYFGCMDFAVYALDAKTGWLQWREATDGFVISSPLIAGDRLYVGSQDTYLWCMDRRKGTAKWKYPAGQPVNTSPVLGNGLIFFGCDDGAVYAINAQTGKLHWRFKTGAKVVGSPVYHEGVVYIGSCDGKVYALDANG